MVLSFPSKKRGAGVCLIPSTKRGLGCVNTMKITYNPNLKDLARKLRKKSTKSEIKLWQYLKGKKMMGYDFHRQKPIDAFVVGCFCNKLKLVVELDGYTHTFEETSRKDAVKQGRLQEFGLTVLRFCDEDVMKNTEGVLGAIGKYIRNFEERHGIHTP